MAGVEALGGFARNPGLAKPLLGKHDCKRAQIALRPAGEANQRGGIDATRKKNTERNIGNQVIADGFFQQRPQLFCRVRQIFGPRAGRMERCA